MDMEKIIIPKDFNPTTQEGLSLVSTINQEIDEYFQAISEHNRCSSVNDCDGIFLHYAEIQLALVRMTHHILDLTRIESDDNVEKIKNLPQYQEIVILGNRAIKRWIAMKYCFTKNRYSSDVVKKDLANLSEIKINGGK